MSYINDNVKLFIRFCKIHDLYGFIKKYYSSILHLNADLNDRLVSTDCDAGYLVSKQIQRDEKINKFNELWQEFAKEQIKKDNDISFKKYINKYAASLSNSYYSTVHLDRISQQIKSMPRILPGYYLNN